MQNSSEHDASVLLHGLICELEAHMLNHCSPLSTGCSPAGFSTPGSVLHTGLAEPRAALPDGGLARVWAGGRLEGRAGVREQKHAIKHTVRHRSVVWAYADTTSSVWDAHIIHLQVHGIRFHLNISNSFPWLPWASVAAFLGSSELQKGDKKHWDLTFSLPTERHALIHLIYNTTMHLEVLKIWEFVKPGKFYSTLPMQRCRKGTSYAEGVLLTGTDPTDVNTQVKRLNCKQNEGVY